MPLFLFFNFNGHRKEVKHVTLVSLFIYATAPWWAVVVDITTMLLALFARK